MFNYISIYNNIDSIIDRVRSL